MYVYTGLRRTLPVGSFVPNVVLYSVATVQRHLGQASDTTQREGNATGPASVEGDHLSTEENEKRRSSEAAPGPTKENQPIKRLAGPSHYGEESYE